MFCVEAQLYAVCDEYKERNADAVYEECARAVRKESDGEIPQLNAKETSRAEEFADNSHNSKRKRKAESGCDAVDCAVKYGLFARKCLRSSEDQTVYDDQRQKYAHRVVKVGQELIEEHTEQCYKRCYDNDERGDSHRARYYFAEQRNDNVAQKQDDGNGKSHSQTAEGSCGHSERCARAEYEFERGVVIYKSVHRNFCVLIHACSPPFAR